MSTTDNNGIDPEKTRATLRSLGWNGGEPDVAPAPALEDEDPLSALDINSYSDVRTLPIPEEVLADMAPPVKERIRRVAGGRPEAEPQPDRDPWSRDVPELGKISVGFEELDEYTRALLFDERFELTIGVYVGEQHLKVRVRSLYISEREVMALAVNQIAEEYPIKTIHNASVIADYLMKCCALIQVVSVNGVDQKPFDAMTEDGELPENSPKVAELKRAARTRYGQTHQAKLKALIRVLHIFETKQQILEDAYYNRDFPRPVDAY